MRDETTAERSSVGIAMTGVGASGILAVIAGTFLPWVRSGLVDRNLYAIAGVADRLQVFGPGASISGWLALAGPLCVVPVLLAVLRLRRSAAILALLLAVLFGGTSALVLVVAGGRTAGTISLSPIGPATVLGGAVLLGSAAVLVLATARTGRRTAPRPTTAIGEIAENATQRSEEQPH